MTGLADPAQPARRDFVTGDLVADGRPTSPEPLTAEDLRDAADYIGDRIYRYGPYPTRPDRGFVEAVARQLRHERERAHAERVARERARHRPLDIAAARARLAQRRPAVEEPAESPPPRPLGAAVFVADDEWRWASVSPVFRRSATWESLTAHLCAASVFTSVEVRPGRLDGPHRGLTSVRTGQDDRAWVTVTVDQDAPPDVQETILRHELAHVADLAACGQRWERLHDPRRRALSEAFAERMETELEPTMKANELIARARLFVLTGGAV